MFYLNSTLFYSWRGFVTLAGPQQFHVAFGEIDSFTGAFTASSGPLSGPLPSQQPKGSCCVRERIGLKKTAYAMPSKLIGEYLHQQLPHRRRDWMFHISEKTQVSLDHGDPHIHVPVRYKTMVRSAWRGVEFSKNKF